MHNHLSTNEDLLIIMCNNHWHESWNNGYVYARMGEKNIKRQIIAMNLGI